ncbi:MAG: hypothetical protein EAZ06_07210 [Cytophagales bacterium]|nr:MAG: hypothetical protein EAZ06_07210 [Cytophagales bacterium]
MAQSDGLQSKSAEELKKDLGSIIEKYAHLDYVFGVIKYSVLSVQKTNEKLTIIENDGSKPVVYAIDVSKMVIGKNTSVKNLGKKSFSIVFNKSIVQKGVSQKARRFEIIFEAKGRKEDDYDVVKQNVENILAAISKKYQM